jgi:hypothetical protein
VTEEGVLNVGAWVLIIFPIFNLFFVRDGWRKYKADPHRSRILFALWVVKLVMWIFGLVFALFAVRYLLDFPPFPFNGASLIVIVLVVELLPAFIYSVLSTYDGSG